MPSLRQSDGHHLREALASPEPEPVALESVHLTQTREACVSSAWNGRRGDPRQRRHHRLTWQRSNGLQAPPAKRPPLPSLLPLTEAAQDYVAMPRLGIFGGDAVHPASWVELSEHGSHQGS